VRAEFEESLPVEIEFILDDDRDKRETDLAEYLRYERRVRYSGDMLDEKITEEIEAARDDGEDQLGKQLAIELRAKLESGLRDKVKTKVECQLA
jgi:hypothetical protein